MAEQKDFDFIILGGGVSGLGFAKRMTEAGYSVLILEKESSVGGLSRSIAHNGFYLDFCAHRFHTNNTELLDEILALDGLSMQKHIKKSRIYIFGKYLKYPFELESLFRAMPLKQSLSGGISFLFKTISRNVLPKPKLHSYRDWFVYLYGRPLYNIMCEPYTSKIWQTTPDKLSADWADQRFKTENLSKLSNRILKKLFTLNFSNYKLEDESLAPDGGTFYYPQKGIQELPNALAKAVMKKGGQIYCNAIVSKVNRNEKFVNFILGDREYKIQYKKIISTIPIHEFYKLQEKKSAITRHSLNGLKYMNIIFVYLFLKREKVSHDHWIYFPDNDIIFNRAVEFSNWSPKMCPTGKTSICFDITSFDDKATWLMSDDELINKVVLDSVRIGYINEADIESSLVFRLKNAYPFYDLEYRTKLDAVVQQLEDSDTFLLGRTGIFRYNNSDNSIEMGFELAEKILRNTEKASAYSYSVINPSL